MTLRFLVDASCDARIASYLRSRGYDASRIGSDYPPDLPDSEVLRIANDERRILVTDDRDFGELVFRLGQTHTSVIYLRLASEDVGVRCSRLSEALERHSNQLDQFIVVSSREIRVR